MRKLVLVLTALAFAACSGDTGPTGPAGPAGPTGATGPAGLDGTSAVITWDVATIDASGDAALIALNAQIETSVINCYTGVSLLGPWIAIAFDSDGGSTIACGATNVLTDLLIELPGGVPGCVPGWFFLVTMVQVP